MEIERSGGECGRPRRTDGGNIRRRLEDILIIGLCTLICNGNDFVDMEAFGKQREEWLRGFLTLPDGIPDSAAFRRVFERLNPEALSECLYARLECSREEGSVIAVDGKPLAEAEGFPVLRAVGIATAQVVRDGGTTSDRRYFISSLTDVGKFADVVRKH